MFVASLRRVGSFAPAVESGKDEFSGAEISKAMPCFSQPSNLLAYILLLSLTQRKKQRNIRPSKASPQGEDANK